MAYVSFCYPLFFDYTLYLLDSPVLLHYLYVANPKEPIIDH